MGRGRLDGEAGACARTGVWRFTLTFMHWHNHVSMHACTHARDLAHMHMCTLQVALPPGVATSVDLVLQRYLPGPFLSVHFRAGRILNRGTIDGGEGIHGSNRFRRIPYEVCLRASTHELGCRGICTHEDTSSSRTRVRDYNSVSTLLRRGETWRPCWHIPASVPEVSSHRRGSAWQPWASNMSSWPRIWSRA